MHARLVRNADSACFTAVRVASQTAKSLQGTIVMSSHLSNADPWILCSCTCTTWHCSPSPARMVVMPDADVGLCHRYRVCFNDPYFAALFPWETKYIAKCKSGACCPLTV